MKTEYLESVIGILNSKFISDELKGAKIIEFKAEKVPNKKTQIKIKIKTNKPKKLFPISDLFNYCGTSVRRYGAILTPNYEGYDPLYDLRNLEFIINLKTGGFNYEL